MCFDDLLPPVPVSESPDESERQSRPVNRVAMISVHTSPLASLGGRDTGGMNVYIKRLSEQLAGEGVPVDVYTRKADPSVPLIQEDTTGFRVINLSVGPAEPVSREVLYSLLPRFSEAVSAFRSSHGHEYDVIHSHYWLSGLVGRSLAESWEVPWVHMSHTLGVLKDENRGAFQQPESELRLRNERLVLESADAVVASNLVERGEILDYYGLDPSRVYVAPCGVDLKLFHPDSKQEARRRLGIDPKRKLVLYVGRIEPLKNVDTLIAAVHQLQGRVDNLKLLIVGGTRGGGDSETRQELLRLEALVRDLGLEDMVEFYGPAPQQELPSFYQAADVSVVPSHYESFGMAALEAMACGTPVVASRVGGLKSSVRDGNTGFLVSVGDVETFAARIERVLADKDLAVKMSINAARTARRYSWRKVAESNLDVYRRAIAASNYGIVVPNACYLTA